jgi:drug/metabolite transporter (DMT)-like permease
MSIVGLTPAQPTHRAVEGIACICIGMFFFVGQDVIMKELLGLYALWELLIVRSVITSLVLVPTIILLGAPHRIFTPFWPLHITRALLFAVGFSCFYAAFPFMTLASVSTIFFASPLITSVFAMLFLGERVGVYRASALIIGFSGVVIALNPGGDSFQWVAILPLICAFTYAASQTVLRKIGEQETTLTTGTYTIIFAGLFILPSAYGLNEIFGLGDIAPHLRWEWQGPTSASVVQLVGLGGVGIIGYFLLCRAYQVAEAGLVAPFEYIYLPIAALIGFVFWNEVPKFQTLVGMFLITGSGLFVGYREAKSSQRLQTPAPTAEASFVPGNPVPPADDVIPTIDQE